MKQFLILSIFSTLFQSSFSQEIDVERSQFKGVKKVVVKAYGRLSNKFHYYPNKFSGFQAEYSLNDSGKAVIEKRYSRGKLVAISEYTYYNNGLLSKYISKINFSSEKDTDYTTAQYDYKFNDRNQVIEKKETHNDQSYILTTLNYDDVNYVTEENSEFFLRDKVLWRRINHYDDGIIKQADYFSDSTSHKRAFQCDKYGNILRSDLFAEIDKHRNPIKGEYADGYPGDHEHIHNFYVYDARGRWIKKYRVLINKNLLIEKRIFIE